MYNVIVYFSSTFRAQIPAAVIEGHETTALQQKAIQNYVEENYAKLAVAVAHKFEGSVEQ